MIIATTQHWHGFLKLDFVGIVLPHEFAGSSGKVQARLMIFNSILKLEAAGYSIIDLRRRTTFKLLRRVTINHQIEKAISG